MEETLQDGEGEGEDMGEGGSESEGDGESEGGDFFLREATVGRESESVR